MRALLLYRIIFLLLLPILLLALFIRSISNTQYRQRLNERLGFFPKPFTQGGIVVHAASVGEVIALTPFIEKLLTQYTLLPITVTTFTPTGSAQVHKQFGSRVQHSFLPIDIWPCTQLFLSRLQPRLVIFMETELWPNLIAMCTQKNIKLLLINGRLSRQSLKSYQKITPLITPALNRFDKILCQSHESYEHFIQLGAQNHRTEISGNLKFDLSVNQTALNNAAQLQQLLPSNRSIWLVASTHEGDEAIVLSAFKKLKAQFPQLLLVLVPRHPERFNSVASLCKSHYFTLVKRSEKVQVTTEDIWLLDTLGELMAAFSLADIVTMGGSFSHIGGHNPLEPALFKKPIIVGHNMSNFTEIMQQLQQEQAVAQLPSPTTCGENKSAQLLAKKVNLLLKDQPKAELLGNNAHKVVLANQGASAKALAQTQTLISS
ncbi:MAG: lipid IV(A) 3-deoxy-D-manno-octulosonic acid transferase [Litorilituus sp.]|jgi:3-deoxy-D-manno-octulosonic-acid transferase|nr:lipid IV(A) 3-deoxy-D-manno-octulosonic acid transferase [Litorilituus sp.]